MKCMERENMVKSVSRALDIIEMAAGSRGGLGVTEIANRMDINKSSVHRLLSTLIQYDYMEQDEQTGRYKLGYAFLGLSSKLLDSIDVREEARPFLKALEQETKEVIHLVVYDQGEVVYIEKLEGTEILRMHSKVGKRAPVHCTSAGKAILAHLPAEEAEAVIRRKGLPRHTEKTITELPVLLKELEQVREEGYALDLEENENGITCIGVPVFDHFGRASAGISISGATERMTPARIQGLKKRMLETGNALSARLGYRQIND